jgi:hypothetical protein
MLTFHLFSFFWEQNISNRQTLTSHLHHKFCEINVFKINVNIILDIMHSVELFDTTVSVFPSSGVLWGRKVHTHLHPLETAALHQWASDPIGIFPPTHHNDGNWLNF